MDNPWKHIPFSDYERHMSDPTVGQLSTLRTIFQQQYSTYKPASLVIFGICTGIGLEHVDPTFTKIVTGVDINAEYLKECASRFGKRGYELNLIEADLNVEPLTLHPSDLLIANLFLEYVDLQKFLSVVKEFGNERAAVSVVIQMNNNESFVSTTNIKSFESLSGFHVDIDPAQLQDTMERNLFELIYTKKYPLPGKKEFFRFDFIKRTEA
ncbi:MAG: methyltransferase domain-containing protein [Ignavibacteriales bacterium]|nr:methyltransferase domain-containing protein [Ignavibacteriales bacterium]